MVTLTALDFLGFGLPPGSPSLGELLEQGKNNLQAPWLGFTGFVVIALMLTLLVFIGEAARDAFDPRRSPGLRAGGGAQRARHAVARPQGSPAALRAATRHGGRATACKRKATRAPVRVDNLQVRFDDGPQAVARARRVVRPAARRDWHWSARLDRGSR